MRYIPTFYRDQEVVLIENTLPSLYSRSSHVHIPLGTKGSVRAIRIDTDGVEYLVKFKGYGGDRHVTEACINGLLDQEHVGSTPSIVAEYVIVSYSEQIVLP